jgi:hypothetical protein
MSRVLPIELQRFVESHITNVEHLEVLMFVARDPSRFWDAKSVGETLYLTERDAARCLETLTKSGFLDVKIGTEVVVYRFSPASPAMTARMQQLSYAYVHDRSSVLMLVSSPRRKSLKDLSDAFKIGGDPSNHG